MTDITLEDVTVRFVTEHDGERVTALDEASLEVRSGELMTLVGPSGSGKSTLLRTIAGLETPQRGVVRIGGTVANAMSVRDRDVALVAQFDTLLPHLSVEGNLAFPLQLRQVSADETSRRVSAEARTLGLWSKLRRRPRQLSSGERQKAALGRATTRRPRAYLFDEPLAGLDASERDRVRRELRQLQRGMGVTAIYVTHDQRDAMALGDRVAVMSGGRVLQVDEPMRVYERPADLFVARFFGNPPMGVVEGRLRDDGTTAWIDVGGTALRLHPTQHRAVVDAATGPAIAIGVRAGAVGLPADGAPLGEWHRRVPVTITSVEPLGASTIVSMQPDGVASDGRNVLYASLPPLHLKRGAQLSAVLDLRDSMVFDVTTGARLLPS